MTTAATSLNAGTYADSTGSGAGWNGTLALYRFVNTQAWVPSGTALLSNTSATYTGTANNAWYQVAVTAQAATTVNVTWSGQESGSGVATKGSAFAIGTLGLTITFNAANTYLTTDTYTIKADVLPTTALVMATGGSCVAQGTTASGANLPAMTNTSATITGGTYNTFGSAVKVITAAVNTGIGTFICTPKATISTDFEPHLGLVLHGHRPVLDRDRAVRMRRRVGLATLAVAGCALTVISFVAAPRIALAATSGTGTDTFTVTGGSLGLASVGSASFAVTLGSGTVTTAATNLNSGNYSDTTGQWRRMERNGGSAAVRQHPGVGREWHRASQHGLGWLHRQRPARQLRSGGHGRRRHHRHGELVWL